MSSEERFDAIVIGAGPGGETAVGRLQSAGMRVALVERELLGGECAYWACIPSKTLLRAAEVPREAGRTPGTETPRQNFGEIAAYRDFMIRDRDDTKQYDSYGEQGVSVVRGAARLDGPGRVMVDGAERTLLASRVILATGSETAVPPIDGLAETGYWTNRDATTIEEPPDSVAVLGGGPVGIELAQLLRRLGARVELVEHGPRVLSREDPRVSELIEDALRADGITLHLGAEATSIQHAGEERTITLRGSAVATIRARELLVVTSRTPRTAGLGLDSVGISGADGGIPVDDRCRAADRIWAIGDVTGVMPFTHVAEYQGRIAAADILGGSVSADYRAIPRVVFTDPEIAAVGVTEAEAADAGLDVATARVMLPDTIARPWIQETDPRGELGVIVDRERGVLAGAWAVAPLAGEWIHYAALAIKAQVPVTTLIDTVAQFPTYTEAYLSALEEACA